MTPVFSKVDEAFVRVVAAKVVDVGGEAIMAYSIYFSLDILLP